MSSPAQVDPMVPAPSLHTDMTRAARVPGLPPVRLAALLVMVFALFGVLGALYTIVSGIALLLRRYPGNVFFRLYALHEMTFMVALIITAIVVLVSVSWPARVRPALLGRLECLATDMPVWGVAVAVLVVTAAGTLLVMHGIGLSMDEFAAGFQARIFSSGHLTAAIPAQWQGLASWMTPIFITYKPEQQLWIAAYLPVYASIRALFVPLQAEWLVNPLLAAASVVLLDRVAWRIWPGNDRRRVLALLFLVTSAQFLVTSMSGYSMPAHLCFNLLWLLLYLRDDRASYLAAPLVGVLAMGLHNPFPHALFVAPFLVRLLLRRRFSWVAYMGAVYLAGAALWLRWLRFAGNGGGERSQTLLSSFMPPDEMMRFVHGLNLTLVLSWQTPLLAVMLVLALLQWRELQTVERDLAVGLVVTFAFYLLFPANQGHGWGYRYIYGALGNVILLAVAGTALAARRMPDDTLRTLLAVSFAASVAFLIPLRLRQTEVFVRPYASAMHFIAAHPAPIVAVDYGQGWYTTDLIRNDPLFREGPRVIAFDSRMSMPIVAVPPALRDSIFVISRTRMEQFGLPMLPLPKRPPPSAR